MDTANATTEIGTILSVINDNSTIIVDKIAYPGNLKFTIGTSIYFTSNPFIGNKLIGNADYSFNSGYKNIILSPFSFSSGRYNIAAGSYAHVEGKQTLASWGSHAEGCSNRSLGECSHTEGRVNTVRSPYSSAIGSANRIEEKSETSFAAGYLSRVKHPCSFVWNGEKKSGYRGNPSSVYRYGGAGAWSLVDTEILSTEINYQDKRSMEYMDSDIVLSSMYESNGEGTFNINPQDGLSGFYIGEKNLHQILLEYAGSGGDVNPTPLAGKEYTSSTPLSSMIIDIIVALGGTYEAQ